MAPSKALLIGSTVILVTVVLALVWFLYFLWQRRNRNSNRGSPSWTTRQLSLSPVLFRHKRSPSDASRLLPLLNPSEPLHGRGRDPNLSFTWTPYEHTQAQNLNQFDFLRQYAPAMSTPSTSATPMTEILPPLQSLSAASISINTPPIPTSIPVNTPPIAADPTPDQRDRSLSSSTTTTSIRLLPALPLPSRSELEFKVSRDLPALFIPATPYPDSPLASSVRLTPGPLSAIVSPPADGRSNTHDTDATSPSIYSPSPSPPTIVTSPPAPGRDSLNRLNTTAIGHMLQFRAKAGRRNLSRASNRSSSLASRLGRQNSILSVLSTVDVAETPGDEDGIAPETQTQAAIAGPSSNLSTTTTTVTKAQDPTLVRKRSRSPPIPQPKRRLLPPTPPRAGPAGSLYDKPSGSWTRDSNNEQHRHGHHHHTASEPQNFGSVATPATGSGGDDDAHRRAGWPRFEPGDPRSLVPISRARLRPPLPVPPVAGTSSATTSVDTTADAGGSSGSSGRSWRALPDVGRF